MSGFGHVKAAILAKEGKNDMIHDNQRRVTEPLIQHDILRLLAGGQVWTNARIKRELGNVLPLSAADRATANCRANEEKWEELVNNALSPSRSNSLTARGFVETVEWGHHRITDAGRKKLEDDDTFAAGFHKAMASPEAERFLRKLKDHHNRPSF
ncbi:hypothetical protein [Sinorhizobium meliloti]|uniref:hypothetical protein n=2 Tax=Rhizobium meliloti TaxID=382 RepID=UPI0012BD2105|nr:hypothetical protein [Sinorhizobium meliloti]